MKKFEKETRHRLYVFKKIKQKSTRKNARQQHARMTLSVHLHRHDVLHLSLTVLLRCPITIIVLIMKFVLHFDVRVYQQANSYWCQVKTKVVIDGKSIIMRDPFRM